MMGDVALGVIDIISSGWFLRLPCEIFARRIPAYFAGGHSEGCLSEMPAICASSPPGFGLPWGQPRRFPL